VYEVSYAGNFSLPRSDSMRGFCLKVFEITFMKTGFMYSYDTVSSAVNGLKQRGYTMDFNLSENCLICHGDKFDINDFEIAEFHRFEGESDPADAAIVYAIEGNRGQKGVLVTGYGTSAEGTSAEMAKKLHVHRE
jgi:hypothetical protein